MDIYVYFVGFDSKLRSESWVVEQCSVVPPPILPIPSHWNLSLKPVVRSWIQENNLGFSSCNLQDIAVSDEWKFQIAVPTMDKTKKSPLPPANPPPPKKKEGYLSPVDAKWLSPKLQPLRCISFSSPKNIPRCRSLLTAHMQRIPSQPPPVQQDHFLFPGRPPRELL